MGKKQVQKSNPELATEHQTIIVDSLINRDKEGIKRVLCPYVTKRMKDIDEQIEKAFDFFDGDVICYDEPSSSGGIGGWDKEFYGTDTRHVITDKGTEYIIGSKWYAYDKASEKISVKFIYVINETKRLQLEGAEDSSGGNQTDVEYMGRDISR